MENYIKKIYFTPLYAYQIFFDIVARIEWNETKITSNRFASGQVPKMEQMDDEKCAGMAWVKRKTVISNSSHKSSLLVLLLCAGRFNRMLNKSVTCACVCVCAGAFAIWIVRRVRVFVYRINSTDCYISVDKCVFVTINIWGHYKRYIFANAPRLERMRFVFV